MRISTFTVIMLALAILVGSCDFRQITFCMGDGGLRNTTALPLRHTVLHK